MVYTNTYETTDMPKTIIDFLAGVFAGLAGFALVIGLGIGIGMISKHFPWLKMR